VFTSHITIIDKHEVGGAHDKPNVHSTTMMNCHCPHDRYQSNHTFTAVGKYTSFWNIYSSSYINPRIQKRN